MKKKIAWLIRVVLALSPDLAWFWRDRPSLNWIEPERNLKEHGIMVGEHGDMIFQQSDLAHLAVPLARLVGNPEHHGARSELLCQPVCLHRCAGLGQILCGLPAIPTGWWPDTETACMAPMIQLHLKQRARSCLPVLGSTC